MSTEQAKITVVFGKRGSGKSVKARRLVAGRSRVLFYDSLGHDYDDGVICEGLATLKSFWKTTYRRKFRIVFRPDDPEGDFETVCSMVYAAGDLAFVVEETDLFFSPGGNTCDAFKNLIQRGRHANVDLFCVTQSPTGFGRLLTKQTDVFYLFSTREPSDLEYFRKRCGQAVSEKLPTLAKFEYVVHNDYEDKEVIEVFRDDPPELG